MASGCGLSLQVALKVGMSCQGCVGAVERVLKKMPGTSGSVPCVQESQAPFSRLFFVHTVCYENAPVAGVESVDIDLPSQKVLVKGDVTPEAVVQQVSKTGKPTELWT